MFPPTLQQTTNEALLYYQIKASHSTVLPLVESSSQAAVKTLSKHQIIDIINNNKNYFFSYRTNSYI